ncbi:MULTISPECIES: hypothetical protein [Bradyrhizobium]|jgi:predicted HTH transcriptional regulator|uniref:hypothetical protein n=1 Tax=Bradyrhizobium TaxID=374 RepID=UPI0004115CAF|nr:MULTISPECIES: hypothetical protein [Bradyrhizobium]MBR0882448.1 hypothetical protein [Bradyrhizobium liaoningense]MBR0948758.1 hypothetical protein [Bradyrhizobium liaoningense]MBR1002266.1 hypothetical protein [Bradyrhizobium liaoningense]MBR1031946.1 hypothetical protein [Bradyrhizobium liaoningense]MBR1068621.1 hypothetical protein [Bradyrhizobium liaoningense]
MGSMKDKLGDTPYTYPSAPGWKEGETSREAAEEVAGGAEAQRRRAFAYIRENPGHTADEIAAALRESVLTIRPRISELRKMQLITNEGRGRNRSGKAAHCWRVR